MAEQPLLTHSQRHIAGSVIYCGTEFREVLAGSTLRDPKKPIAYQVRQIYERFWRRGQAAQHRQGRSI